jgi:hypothetical protein
MSLMPDRPKPLGWNATRTEAVAQRTGTPKQPTPKAPLAPPKGKGGELWKKLFESGKQINHPDPEAFADAALRVRERSIALTEAAHKLKVIDKPPKAIEAAVAAKTAKACGPICRAKTLEGRPCRFKATCGEFCKKHAPH